MTEKYRFDYSKLNVPSRYSDIAKFADCVQFKPLYKVFEKKETQENDDGICSIDIHNLPFLHYLTYNMQSESDYKMLVDGFCIHQGIGFTIIINDLALHKYDMSQQLDILEKCKGILQIIYNATVSSNDVTGTFIVVTIIDLIHHTMRIITAFPYLLTDPICASNKILHNIMHWITFFMNVYYHYFINYNDQKFETCVHKPILLSSWLCINGCD